MPSIYTNGQPPSRRRAKKTKAWRTYEEVAAYVLAGLAERLGIHDVKGKIKLRGKTGTDWEIDAHARRQGDDALVYIECRRRKARIGQGAMGHIAYAMHDVGAGAAITVSPLPLQKGAAKIATAEGALHVILSPDSSFDEWVAQLAGAMHFGLSIRESVKAGDSVEAFIEEAANNTA